jgi:hypothetical protein
MGSARELEYSVLVEIKGWMARLGNHHFHQRVQIDALACSNQQCSNKTKYLIVDFALLVQNLVSYTIGKNGVEEFFR